MTFTTMTISGGRTINVHPAADLFPLMADAELAELAADIKTHGLQSPIVLHPAGSILDGRNRYRACKIAGVIDPDCETYTGDDPLAYVVSVNLRRRHLTAEQKREVVASLLKANPE